MFNIHTHIQITKQLIYPSLIFSIYCETVKTTTPTISMQLCCQWTEDVALCLPDMRLPYLNGDFSNLYISFDVDFHFMISPYRYIFSSNYSRPFFKHNQTISAYFTAAHSLYPLFTAFVSVPYVIIQSSHHTST